MKRYTSEELIDREAAVHLATEHATRESELHQHDFWELVYIREGHAYQVIDGEEYEVRRGDLLLMREGQTHSFRGEPAFSYINLCIDPRLLLREGNTPSAASELFLHVSFFDILERRGCLIHFTERERLGIEALLATMLSEYGERRFGWQKIVRHYLDVFFLLILRALEERDRVTVGQGVWEQLAAYIDENLTADLSLSALAARLFYNPSYLSRCFSAHFGCGVSAYVSARRAERAAHLAATGHYTVERLAEESGFASKSALYRAFRAHKGEELGAFLAKCKKTNS